MKILFLDVDGVLNGARFMRALPQETRWDEQIDPAAVARLDRILRATGAGVVVSSTWRLSYSALEIADRLIFLGGMSRDLRPRFVGVTPRRSVLAAVTGRPLERGDEIQAWIAAHPAVEEFAILDDADDMASLADHLVRTRWELGLQDAEAELAIAMLQEI